MTPEPQLEERLRAALGRPHGAAWPDERGAFDRFLRHRNRRGRILAGQAAVVIIVALALAVVTPRLLPGGSLPSVTPPGRVLRAPGGGFEVTVPAGWTRQRQGRLVLTPGGDNGSVVALRPERRAAETFVVVSTGLLSPAQYPGIEPGHDPEGLTADRSVISLEDAGSPLGRGRRPDGRPFVWQTLLTGDEVARYAVAWPYHCDPGQACPPTAPWRVLFVYARTGEGPATAERVGGWFGASSTRPGRSPMPSPVAPRARST
jgi:hypothetical protein